MKKFFLVISLSLASIAFAQFAPPVGQAGTTAIAHDSTIIDVWLENATIQRGYQDIATGTTLASHGTVADAEGEADNSVVSLGDSGVVTYTLSTPLSNIDGYDFAVFENSFSDDYLELAFVEVSSDGQYFVRFPATSNVQTATQVGSFGLTDATAIHNLAGKYRGMYGTPFELEDLLDSNNVDINSITHIRIVDVVGSIDPNFGTMDHMGTMVNDPYPTDFASGGFDLDGVALLKPSVLEIDSYSMAVKVYPNPATNYLSIQLEEPTKITVYSVAGKSVFQQNMVAGVTQLDIANWESGVYVMVLEEGEERQVVKLVKR